MSPLKWIFFIIVICGNSLTRDEIIETILEKKTAIANRFPYLVRIYRVDKLSCEPVCSGSIVTSKLILTSAHCGSIKAPKLVVFGKEDHTNFYNEIKCNMSINETGYHAHRVVETILHPQFEKKPYTIMHDVCLLRLRKSLTGSDGHAVIPVSYNRVYLRECTVVGYRMTSNSTHKLDSKQLLAEIAWRGNWLLRTYSHIIHEGDSGSPMICGNKLFAVASFSAIDHTEGNINQDFYAYLHEERSFLDDYVSATNGNIPETLFILLTIILFFLTLLSAYLSTKGCPHSPTYSLASS